MARSLGYQQGCRGYGETHGKTHGFPHGLSHGDPWRVWETHGFFMGLKYMCFPWVPIDFLLDYQNNTFYQVEKDFLHKKTQNSSVSVCMSFLRRRRHVVV